MRHGWIVVVLALTLIAAPRLARADCDATVGAGATLARTGCQYINYRRCHWETEFNDCLDSLEAKLNEFCVTFPAVTETNWDGFDVFPAPYDLTLIDVGCYCHGTCSSPIATLTFTDSSDNAIGLAGGGSLTCQSGNSVMSFTAFDTADTDRNLLEGERVRPYFASPTSTDDLTVCFRW